MSRALSVSISLAMVMGVSGTSGAQTRGAACTAQTLRTSAARGDISTVKGCLAAKVPVDAPNASGLTALMLAAANGHREVVMALAAAGANVNLATERDGLTPLMFAAHWGQLSSAAALIEKGANPLSKDKGDRNAVDWASDYADGRKEAAIATAKYLMSKGTPLVQRNGLGLFLSVGSKPNIDALVSQADGSAARRGGVATARGAQPSAPQAQPTLAILFLEKQEGTVVDLRMIAVATQEQATAALARLGGGESFAKVAEALSLHSTKSAGGYLGRFELGDLRDDYRSALMDVPVGKYTRVFPFK